LFPRSHKKLIRLSTKDFTGQSFLLNPKVLLNDNNSTVEEKVEYIALASKRNLANYLLLGEKKLDCRLVRRIPTENKLLTTSDNAISFAYE
jgi:hypothetical protein